jgi:hypothetical protein
MNKLIIIAASLGALAGCAAPGPHHYGSGASLPPDASGQWQVVSVTPVPLGTGARAAAAGDVGTTTYHEAPVYLYRPPVYAQQPVYGVDGYPVYAPPPVYRPRYITPPMSIGLGFHFGRDWGHHRGWGGSIGTRFPYHYRR